MSLQDELSTFYAKHGFGPVLGRRPRTVSVYTGCLLVPMPNIETRQRYLKYHDLHHLVTGYSVGRIGEGEVSAWELGSGSWRSSPTLAMMNLVALSTGLVLQPRRMWRAFLRGSTSSNLYAKHTRADVDTDRWVDVDDLRRSVFGTRPQRRWRAALCPVEFAVYAIAALVIHASIAVPALIVRFVTDITLGHSVIQAIKPKTRQDLF